MWGTPPGSGFTAKGHLQESTQGVLVQVHHTTVSTSGERNPAVSWRASPSNIRIPKEAHVAFSSKHGNCYQSILVVTKCSFCCFGFLPQLHKVLPRWLSITAPGNCTGKQPRANMMRCFSEVHFRVYSWKQHRIFFFFKHFTPETTSHLARAGFLFKSLNAFLPWHERQMLKQQCKQETTRTAARNHLAQHLPGMEPQFCMYIGYLGCFSKGKNLEKSR